MALIDQFSETNLATNLAVFLASNLLALSYLVYWHQTDALQTPDGYYYGWSVNFNALKTNPTLAGRISAAKGLVTIRPQDTAKPVYPVRHTLDASVTDETEAQVPWLAVEVDAEKPATFSGLGDRQRTRYRNLTIYGCARGKSEMSSFRDSLVRWFDDTTFLPLQDYDAGSTIVFADVELELPIADSAIIALSPEASRYEVILNARLRYEA